jgi:hypothetical protein
MELCMELCILLSCSISNPALGGGVWQHEEFEQLFCDVLLEKFNFYLPLFSVFSSIYNLLACREL